MKLLPLFAFAACTLPVQAQTPGPARAPAFSAVVRISAELTRKIDSKDAKPGDLVAARTTAPATLADGTELPKGTALTGTVTAAQAKSNAVKNAHLAFTFDRAISGAGKEIPVHVTLTALSVPSSGALNASEDMFANVGQTSTGAASGKRGMSGPRAAAGATNAASGETIGGVDVSANEGNTVRPVATTNSDLGGSVGGGSYVSDALSVHRYMVANLPGVILSSQATARDSGALDASGQNISLAPGTRMTANASVILH